MIDLLLVAFALTNALIWGALAAYAIAHRVGWIGVSHPEIEIDAAASQADRTIFYVDPGHGMAPFFLAHPDVADDLRASLAMMLADVEKTYGLYRPLNPLFDSLPIVTSRFVPRDTLRIQDPPKGV